VYVITEESAEILHDRERERERERENTSFIIPNYVLSLARRHAAGGAEP
jgi:hypothetical protein